MYPILDSYYNILFIEICMLKILPVLSNFFENLACSNNYYLFQSSTITKLKKRIFKNTYNQ